MYFMKIWVLFFVCFSMSLTSAAFAKNWTEQSDLQREAIELFWPRNFEKLNEKAKEYVDNQSRLASGGWKLEAFYWGIYNTFGSPPASDEVWGRVFNICDEWIKKYPDAPSGYIAKANFLFKLALRERGDGFVGEVSKDQWAAFDLYSKQARDLLQDNKEVASRDPKWYALMVSISRSRGDRGGVWDTFEESISRYPTYHPIYNAVVLSTLSKWGGGGRAHLESFANEELERTRDKVGFATYTRIYWSASALEYQGQLFKETDVDWSKMRKGFEDIVKKYPDEWNINNFAYFACFAKDRETTQSF